MRLNHLSESLRQLFGAEPRRPRPEEISPQARAIHQRKRLDQEDLEALRAQHARHANHRWRNRRWVTLIAVNLLFLLSYALDIQLLEGALTASRFMGLHMADLNSALQVMLAFKQLLINLLIGTATVLLLWLLLGGRSFCAWVCPYHLLAEWTEALHLKLAARGWVRDRPFDRRLRSLLYLVFALLALVTGYTVFETLSPTGIVSRALIYGPGLALLWVAVLLGFELLVSRRAWCRYLCPIGLTYGLVGALSPTRVRYRLADCKHEGECRKVCLVPHVLDPVIKGRARDTAVPIGADCTRCGLCVDVCPTGALRFEIKGLTREENPHDRQPQTPSAAPVTPS